MPVAETTLVPGNDNSNADYNKSALSLVSRLSTPCYRRMQLQCLQQLLIDSWYAAPAAIESISAARAPTQQQTSCMCCCWRSRGQTNRLTTTHTHTCLTALFQGLPGWAGTRNVKSIWILLKQEAVSGSGISWAICKSASRTRQITCQHPTTGLTTTLPIYRPCCAHNVGSIKNVHLLPNNLYHL